jgi:hypothetical protein
VRTHIKVNDERISAENASYRWGYLFIAFGLLLSVAYRGLFLQQQNWDLLALVVLSGAVLMLHESIYSQSWRWPLLTLITVVIATSLGMALVLIL